MTTQDAELDEIIRDFFASRPQTPLDELMAARKAAEQRPPHRTIIPEPVLPPMWPHPDSMTAKFPCGLGCGWAHTENTDPGSDVVSIPLGATVEEIGRAFGELARKRDAETRARIESAVREHFAELHPGVEPPVREVW